MAAASSCEIAEADLAPLATGAWILGTGGGGDPYHSYLNARQLYRGGRRARLIDPAGLEDDALVAVVSHMGAPLVSRERLADPAMIARAVRAMEEFLGRRFDAVMSMEIGGSNALQPLLAAALIERPVVDADGMGRAFPSVFHTSFAVHGYGCAPLSMVDIRGNEAVIAEARDWMWAERLSRRIAVEFGSRAFTCKAPRTGREVKEGAVHHSVSRAIRLGRAVHEARARHEDPIEALLAAAGGRRVFRGKLADVARRTTEGYLRGRAEIDGLEDCAGARFTVEFQNEFLIGWQDGSVIVTVPDLICLLDSESGEAVGTETLRYGQRVTVAALPAPAVFLSEAGLAHGGPGAFGYDVPFTSPFEKEAG